MATAPAMSTVEQINVSVQLAEKLIAASFL